MKKSDRKKDKSSANQKKKSKNKIHRNSKRQSVIENTSENLPPKKTRGWFHLILIAIPVLFISLLELTLQISDYGNNLSQWVEVGHDKLMINPDIGKRYFGTTNFLPKTSDDTFFKQKRNNSFRVFVLGGSSAAGFPFMPMGSFSRYIKKRLEIVYPETAIEVINIGMTAVNSYTILDLIPGVIEQNPDLILIYAGHNEFYGALGVGSLESYGNSRYLKKTLLLFNKFKITQLVRNIISWGLSLLSAEPEVTKEGTLMSKMAKEKSIPIQSDIYKSGIEQFTDNLKSIIEITKENEVPIIVGKLVSNYKDQKPFVSEDIKGLNSANDIYLEAMAEFQNSNFIKAASLFKYAKDLDVLRFRAPEEINESIVELAEKYNIPVAQVDSLFISESPNGIIGNSLMVDHLHPNVEGYILMGKAFYDVMLNQNCLPGYENNQMPLMRQDSITRNSLVFTKLDSVIGHGIVTLLKHDWPFKKVKTNLPKQTILNPQNYIDSISVKYIENKISYVDAYVEAATASLRRDDIESFIEYINTLIYKYPGLKDINTALKYFYDRGKINPKDFNSKRSGAISIYNKDYDKALQFLNDSYKTNSNDTQLLYYLALAHYKKNENDKALIYLEKCLKSEPNNQNGLKLKEKLKLTGIKKE